MIKIEKLLYLYKHTGSNYIGYSTLYDIYEINNVDELNELIDLGIAYHSSTDYGIILNKTKLLNHIRTIKIKTIL